MHIKLSKVYASPITTADAGSVIDVPDEEGRALIEAHAGLEVDDKGKEVKKPLAHLNEPNDPTWQGEENASLTAEENAARRTGRGGTQQRVASGTTGTTATTGKATPQAATGTGRAPGQATSAAGHGASEGSSGQNVTTSQGPAGRNR